MARHFHQPIGYCPGWPDARRSSIRTAGSLALWLRNLGLPVIEAQHFALGTASLGILSVGPAHPEVRVIELWNAAPAVLAGAR